MSPALKLHPAPPNSEINKHPQKDKWISSCEHFYLGETAPFWQQCKEWICLLSAIVMCANSSGAVPMSKLQKQKPTPQKERRLKKLQAREKKQDKAHKLPPSSTGSIKKRQHTNFQCQTRPRTDVNYPWCITAEVPFHDPVKQSGSATVSSAWLGVNGH